MSRQNQYDHTIIKGLIDDGWATSEIAYRVGCSQALVSMLRRARHTEKSVFRSQHLERVPTERLRHLYNMHADIMTAIHEELTRRERKQASGPTNPTNPTNQ